MKEVVYTPKACSKEGAIVSGSVKIRIPNLVERYEYISQVGFKAGADGAIENNLESLKSIAQMVKLSQPHYVSVDIKKSDGTEVKSYDDLITDPDCDEIVIEVAGMLLNGFKASKN